VGDVLLQDDYSNRIILKDVLYVPEMGANLMSVRRLIQKGAEVVFGSEDRATVTRGGRTLLEATCHKDDNIYKVRSTADSSKETALISSSSKASPEVWHSRFAHLGYSNMARLPSMVKGLDLTAADFKAAGEVICGPCIMGKQKRLPFPDSETVTKKPLELVHMDLCGPLAVPSSGGARYIATFLDDYSDLSVIRLLEFKSQAKTAVEEVITYLEKQTGLSVKAIRTDNGKEYINSYLDGYIRSKGIQAQTTVPFTPQQNGKAERLNLTLMDKVRTMLAASSVQPELWGEAVVTANYLRNRSPVTGKDKTPWELFFGNQPDVSNLRTFGAQAFVHVPKEKRTKLDFKSEEGIMVGYGYPSTKGYRILMPDGSIRVSRDVIFNEAKISSSADDSNVDKNAGVSTGKPEAAEQPEQQQEETADAAAQGTEKRVLPLQAVRSAASAAPRRSVRLAPKGSQAAADSDLDDEQHLHINKTGKMMQLPTQNVPEEDWFKVIKNKPAAGRLAIALMAEAGEPSTMDEALSSDYRQNTWQQLRQSRRDCGSASY
jgi:hypothetical protein